MKALLAGMAEVDLPCLERLDQVRVDSSIIDLSGHSMVLELGLAAEGAIVWPFVLSELNECLVRTRSRLRSRDRVCACFQTRLFGEFEVEGIAAKAFVLTGSVADCLMLIFRHSIQYVAVILLVRTKLIHKT